MPANETVELTANERKFIESQIAEIFVRLGVERRMKFDTDEEALEFMNNISKMMMGALETGSDLQLASDDISTRMNSVREHPDFLFGTFFCTHDLPEGVSAAMINSREGEDALVSRGSEILMFAEEDASRS